MMSKLSRKLEIGANVAIILVAILIGAVFVKNYLLSSRNAPENRDFRVPAGTKMALSATDWAQNGQTLLLVLQKGCHFCSESAPFYQRLVRETAGHGTTHLLAVLPQTTDESKRYLNDMGVTIEDVKQAELDSIGVRGTPTLILVNNQGVVMNSWAGKLPADGEADVLRHLQEKPVSSR
ncbi:MAG: hypothetical protein WBP93_10520 [Pyrinomonadaceae bacterium]